MGAPFREWRGYLIDARIKKRWFRPDVVLIHITDGKHDVVFENVGSFVIETKRSLELPALIPDPKVNIR